jgi:hypothetical protein
MKTFLNSYRSEWLKKKRTAGSLLVIVGAFLIPVLVLLARIVQSQNLYEENTSAHMWEGIFMDCWQFMAVMLLPLGVILVTSLITQNEFRNNTWKQVHTTPQRFTTVYFAKLAVIITMLLQFFILFNIGMYLAGIVPGLFYNDIPFPIQDYPFVASLRMNAGYFICCLPIVALQYLLSLRFQNFLLPLGAGIGLMIGSLIGMHWEYGYTLPYSYSAIRFFSMNGGITAAISVKTWALAWFIAVSVLGYVMYIRKKEKS